MARPLRIQYPGAFYHITARGNERKDVYKNNRDREKFLSYLGTATERYGARIHAYCLMSNHYHLLLETPDGNLPQIMRHINGAYTTYFNVKRQRSGHLFQGRYKAILVEADEYATQLSRYIHLNPVRAGMVEEPGDYRWSSYQYYAGWQTPPEWLQTDFITDFFGGKKSIAQKRYREFVCSLLNQEYESPLKEVVASTILGSAPFVMEMQERFVETAKRNPDVPALKELSGRKTVEEIRAGVYASFAEKPQLARKAALYVCHKYSGKKLKEIGDCFGVGDSAVAKTSQRLAELMAKDKRVGKQIKRLKNELELSDVQT